MIAIQEVFDQFFGMIQGDEWMMTEDAEIVTQDLKQMLTRAIFYFRFPRVSLEIANDMFIDETISQDEIIVLAVLMKHEWAKRCVSSWENLRMQYSDSDFAYKFSQANHLDKVMLYAQNVKKEVNVALRTYDRSRGKKPYDFSKLAGGKNQ